MTFRKILVLSTTFFIIWGCIVLNGMALQQANSDDDPAWGNSTGPYEVIMEVDSTLPEHTVYRPEDLSGFPSKDQLPVVIMSGPGCDNDGDSFRPFFTELASYGYLVVAAGLPVPEGARAELYHNKSEDLLAAIDWAFAENSRNTSKYFGKIDIGNVALMGHSCGGSLVMELTHDPRVTTILFWNSGALVKTEKGKTASDGRWATPDDDMWRSQAYAVTLDIPVAYVVAEKDILLPNSLSDYQQVKDAPAFFAVCAIPENPHGGTFHEKNGGVYGEFGVGWMQWQMKGDTEAAQLFKGHPTGFEKADSKWTEIRKKNID
ncbi:hypothetical protein [Fodinibius salsisoli]|uniref:Chlorophyllase enzyme n=1 Tax=Fodinibius salsisoli TaxID=2820877 RepID=A0ABT3PLI8_9BACT|nr:hypothetical protein [Fodinibius salsisoli]MCW9706059.1 hypothetical protein [Fodinibius salsisoli]